MITEHEAIAIALEIGTAMMNGDRPSREAAYAGLDNDSLKRVLRWMTRMMLHNLAFASSVTGQDMQEMWQQLCIAQMQKESEDGE